jgi:hypothetical protein
MPFGEWPLVKDLEDVDQTTQGTNKILAKVTSNGKPFSWVDPHTVEGLLPVADGGTGANLSATGGTSQVLKQSSTGAAVTVGQLALTDISGTLAVNKGGTGQTTAAAALNALGVSAGAVESQIIGSNTQKRGTATLVPADGSADVTVTFGLAFPTAIDNIQLTIRSHTSVTLKSLCPTPNTELVGSFKIHIDGGDAASTASVDWFVIGH